MQKVAQILDKIIFRIIPGLCFLFFFVSMMSGFDTQFRDAGNMLMVALVDLGLVVFSVNLFIWVLFDGIILPPKKETPPRGWLLAPILNFVGVAATVILIAFAHPGMVMGYTYVNMVHAGAVYYGAVVLGDLLYILLDTIHTIDTEKGLTTKLRWGLLGVYFVFLTAINIFTVRTVLLLHSGDFVITIAFVAVPFSISAIRRLQAHKVY